MATTFEGVCCGGPLDGVRHAASVRRFEVRGARFQHGPLLRDAAIGHYQFLVGFWLWKPANTERRHA